MRSPRWRVLDRMTEKSAKLTEAIYNYLASVPADERWGEGELFVKAELHESGDNGELFLSTGAHAHGGRCFLERVLVRVRGGFERGEIEGFVGRLDDESNQLWRHPDAEASAALRRPG